MKKRNVAFGNMVKRLCVLLCLSGIGSASAQVQFLEESTVTTEGLYFYYADGSKAYHYNPNISPRGDCVSVVNGYMFFGWYKGGMSNRNLMISRKKIGSGNWVTVELPHQNTLIGADWGDSHKTISVGVSKIDGTVHIFYDHHNDPLKYIVSKKNIAFAPDSEFTLSNFEATRGWLAEGEDVTITYPKITQNDDGDVIVNYRKGSAVGGDEVVHVYNGVEWTRSKQVSKGRLGDINLNNYAYGVPYYNNGDVYYAFSVRWAAKQDLDILNEGVYLAKCGPTFTDKWEDLEGNLHDLPVDDFEPFLIDLPASAYDKGSSGGPGLVVSEDGDVHITYDGRGTDNTYEYTYTRKAGETDFTKHQGVRKTGLAWNNRFYTINASGSNITITSGEPGSVNYTTELVHSTSRSFGVSGSYIDDGKLVLIVSENKQADKKDIYCYVFQLPVPAPVVQDVDNGDWDTASTWDPDGIPVSTNFYTTDLNLHVNNAATPFGGESLRILDGGLLHLRDAFNPFMVSNLIMSGGGIYAGTGNNNTFALDGNISVISNSVFQGYWNATGPRNLNMLSKISGGAAITSMASDNSSTHTLTIGNAANDFSGTWISQNGTLEFANAGAVGSADIQVLDHGTLTIQGDWDAKGMLAVADAPTAAVNLGANHWRVTDLLFGGVSVDYGTYSPAALNALGSNPVFAGSGTITVVDPTIVTMDVLGSPQTWSTPTVWDNDQVPAAGFDYFVPDTGNLKSPDGNSTFDGDTLTVEGGGKFQFRAKYELGEATTVYNLSATGGTSGKSVNLAAGTGNNTVNHLDGTLENDGFTKLSGYGNGDGPRNIRISSVISGDGTLHSTGTSAYPHTCTIVNANNTFAGVWESNIGTLVFPTGSAVGSADITVLDQGKLLISNDWISYGTLTVADSATAEVDLGFYDWTVSNLVFGASAIAEGTYTAAELNALGANAVFAGTGTIRIGEPLPPPVYEIIAGWDVWDSGATPSASVLDPNVTASAVTTSEGSAWHTADERGASIDGSWGTHEGPPIADTTAGTNNNQNLELPNATTGGTITFTVSNNGTEDIELGAFHFDANAFRTKAARTYELSVVAGSDISAGTVYTSAADAITVGGDDNLAHDDIDISLTDMADHTLAPGEAVQFLLAFSGGEGDGSGGHDLWVDNVGITGAFSEYIAPPVIELIAGWDTWNSGSAPLASVLAADITGSAVATSEGSAWHVADERGASADGTWGTFVSIPSASTVTNTDNENLELPNAATGGTLTFSITNAGTAAIELDAFHFDAYAFRSKAARTYELSVLADGGITEGVIYISGAQEITTVDGEWDNFAHDDIDHSLAGLSDNILGAGESVQFRLTFSGGAGDGSGGHDLWVDNVGITGVFQPVTEFPLLEHSMSGGDMVFDWIGSGFKVQSRTNLTEGIWQDVPDGDVAPVIISPTDLEAFFRLIEK
ncbi:BNR-4 repeat-containing protein [Pontiellaceae bacterium B12227]|nr:BNR-4 repeat-containing protein [Pontiellaceae bacterium B12227]